jgi:hypothetical protein
MNGKLAKRVRRRAAGVPELEARLKKSWNKMSHTTKEKVTAYSKEHLPEVMYGPKNHTDVIRNPLS